MNVATTIARRRSTGMIKASGNSLEYRKQSKNESGLKLTFDGELRSCATFESCSDGWSAHMHMQTNSLNWTELIPLAEVIKLDI